MESNKPVVFDTRTAKALLGLLNNKPVLDKAGKDYVRQIPNGCFAVKVTKTGGSAGSCSTTCSWVYTVKNLAGETLATAQTPKEKRIANLEYFAPAADSIGIAYYDGAGLPILYSVAEEVPVIYIKTDSRTFVTGVTCNGDGTITVDTDTFDISYLSCEA